MTEHSCACGYQASSPDDLTDHLGEMLTPDDGTAPNGQVHDEAPRDEPRIGGIVECLCGFTGTASDLDSHLLGELASGDKTGRDGNIHFASHNSAAQAGGDGDRPRAGTASL
jgi:hypothetical protein